MNTEKSGLTREKQKPQNPHRPGWEIQTVTHGGIHHVPLGTSLNLSGGGVFFTCKDGENAHTLPALMERVNEIASV